MKWSSFVSQGLSLADAVREASQAVTASLHGLSSGAAAPRRVDFAAIFISESWRSRYADLPALLAPNLDARVVVGCSGGGIIGGGEEVEHRPAVSISAALMPGVTIRPFRFEDLDLPDLDASPDRWRDLVGSPAGEEPHFLLLADPFSFRAESLVLGLDYAFPRSVKVGGLASGASAAGGNALYLGDRSFSSGMVGVAFSGNVVLETVVAQGCRPIGTPMLVTACDGNLLLELDHHPPLQILEELLQTLSPRDRELVSHSLFLGVVMDPFKQEVTLGDFLIRNLVGADMQRGILAVGSLLRVGQAVQFHLRDARTSAENLAEMLGHYRSTARESHPLGALLFSCLGRGEYLYGVANHDSRLFTETLGRIPLGGFFCNGEIGPVGRTTYLHGYTSCFGLFRPAARPLDPP